MGSPQRSGLHRALPGVKWQGTPGDQSGIAVSNWTIKESSRRPRRCASGPNLVRANNYAPLPPGMSEELYGGGEPNPIADVQGELRTMWRTTPMNRYYLPISKMPPLRPDPRREYANKAPACYPNLSVSRVERIAQRWESMPQLRRQLPQDDLDDLEQCDQASTIDLSGSRRGNAQTKASIFSGSAISDVSFGEQSLSATVACLACSPGGRSRKSPLHIACTCCEHPTAKPWQSRKPLGAAAQALLGSDQAPSGSPRSDGGDPPAPTVRH